MKEPKTEGHKRLQALYKISKLLATFESVDKSFPKIFALAAEVFPLLNAALVEQWDHEQKPRTTVWSSPDASKAQTEQVTAKVRDIYTYFSGASSSQQANIHANPASITELIKSSKTRDSKNGASDNTIFLPLLIDNLPPLGVLLLEASVKIDEDDLQFANALSDLISVALDRYYKTKRDKEEEKHRAKKGQEKLLYSQEKVADLEVQRELRESFVTLLSHDLGTPLSLILGSAEIIRLNPKDSESCGYHADKIVSAVNRAGQMISDLLDANRIKSGEALPLNVEAFDAVALLENIVDDFAGVYGNRFILKADGSLEVYWDQSGVRRIVENLCNNAIKYGYPDTPITISLKQDEDFVVVSVLNQGDVISPEDQKNLFQQFRRGEKSQNSSIKGWGIGLTLVRGVAEAHGGSVTFKSATDTGTEFSVTIPQDARPFLSKTN